MIEKVKAADVCIWMDAMQYERHGWVNRNRLISDQVNGGYLTVPVNEHDTFAPINRVRIADPTGRAREKIARTLEHRFGQEVASPYADELRRPYELLVGLNWQILTHLFRDLKIDTVHHFQSHLDSGHAVPIVSEDEASLASARERIADMVAEIGGTVWLAGPSRKHSSDEAFEKHGIEVRNFVHDGPNPSAIEMLRKPKR